MIIGLRKSNNLILEERIKPIQTYYPAFKPDEVSSTSIGYKSLSDKWVKRLKEVALQQPSLQFDGSRENAVLEEGILDDKKYGLGQLVVSIQYNFSKDKSFIEVPGKYEDFIYGDGEQPLGISVRLLTPHEQIAFIERILKKSHELDRKYAYTGDYLVWPGNFGLKTLKTRQIRIKI